MANFDFGNTLGNLFSGGAGSGLLGGALGAGLGYFLAPKQHPVSAEQLNATMIPQMRQAANMRMAHLLGAQGAKGGQSSGDILERAMLNQQLSRGIGQQMAMNQVQAQQAQDMAARQRFQDIMSGGMTGYNLASGWKYNPTSGSWELARG